MREWINLIEHVSEGYRDHLDSPILQHVWSFCDWLAGDAMSLVNDDGERFSPAPYYASMVALSRIVPPTRLQQLTGMIYRGASSDKTLELQPGLIKTAQKQFQSWSPSKKIATTFTKQYGGTNAVLYEAPVERNRKRIVISVRDVYTWMQTKPEGIDDGHLEQALYTLESFAHQDEIIIKGQKVDVSNVKVVRHA